jgi:hypothetical protein
MSSREVIEQAYKLYNKYFTSDLDVISSI